MAIVGGRAARGMSARWSAGLPGQLLRFACAGVAGLAVDLAVLFVTAPLLGWYAGRVVSFLAAASTTWWLNRRFTFARAPGHAVARPIRREYVRYVAAMLGGAAINYTTYVLTLRGLSTPWAPALGVAFGSLAGMCANFMAAKFLVFGAARGKPDTIQPARQADAPLRLRPLATWPVADRAGLVGVFTDIDDTLTTDGAITPDALAALADLKAAGLKVVAITGRPVGWSLPFAAAWPVDAIVAENGAVALLPPPPWRPGDSLHPVPAKRYLHAAPTRTANFARMQRVLERIEREIPGARRATDSAGRETDIAIDHSEFTHLDEARIDAVVALMRAEGMHATVSSIHVNGWYGDNDKLVGARWIVRELWDRALDDEIGRWAYVGDSTNDQLMFEAFAHSAGVANVARFVPRLAHLPAYVTAGERGAGFAEVARAVLAVR
jgi:HAD superfamily hydrolase (TIGR01484 family)